MWNLSNGWSLRGRLSEAEYEMCQSLSLPSTAPICSCQVSNPCCCHNHLSDWSYLNVQVNICITPAAEYMEWEKWQQSPKNPTVIACVLIHTAHVLFTYGGWRDKQTELNGWMAMNLNGTTRTQIWLQSKWRACDERDQDSQHCNQAIWRAASVAWEGEGGLISVLKWSWQIYLAAHWAISYSHTYWFYKYSMMAAV